MYWLFVLIGFIPSLFKMNNFPYLLSVYLSVALITSMIHPRIGFLSNFVMLTLLLISTGMNIEIYLLYVIAGSFLCLSVDYVSDRQQMLYVTLSNMLLFVLLSLVLRLIYHGTLEGFNNFNYLYAGLNGSLTVILAYGSEPLWEAIFSISSEARLIELSNSNQELLKRLMMEAPGTYHHSMVVANLAEKATIEVNGNYYLARAAAMYHDIGKLKRPEYFTENQNGYNIHDELSPDASAKYIKDHVQDGVELAKEYHLPTSIQDIIREHQGDALISYFYKKALEHSDGFDIGVEGFKYNGPKPKSKESAIIMLADCVDAATKALGNDKKNLDAIYEVINEVCITVIKNRQLEDTSLSFEELTKVKKAFLAVYNGMFHERIQYSREIEAK